MCSFTASLAVPAILIPDVCINWLILAASSLDFGFSISRRAACSESFFHSLSKST